MSKEVVDNLQTLLDAIPSKEAWSDAQSASLAFSQSLGWSTGAASSTLKHARGLQVPYVEASYAREPAVLFFGDDGASAFDLHEAARFAYHSAVHWGVVTSPTRTIVFNSHWSQHGEWFHFPPIANDQLKEAAELLRALLPANFIDGRLDQYAALRFPSVDPFRPVDDHLVDRLDRWRSEAIRYSDGPELVDEHLHNLFAQFFILRAVEDRGLVTDLPPLISCQSKGELDRDAFRSMLILAQKTVCADLFQDDYSETLPNFVIAGVIEDLYQVRGIPIPGVKYDFSWIDPDVLGRAYQKYLSTILVPARRRESQKTFFDSPRHDVESITKQKAGGVFYTPDFIVRHLAEKCVGQYFSGAPVVDGNVELPKIVDPSCGSGAFLVAAADVAIRYLRRIDETKNWGKELIRNRCLVGVDIDARAVTLAQLSLWLRLTEEPDPLPLPDVRLSFAVGNSLLNATWEGLPHAYDVVLGNPPFISAPYIIGRDVLQERFESARGRFDFSYLFVERSVQLLREGGILGLVVPNRVFGNKDAHGIRRVLSNRTTLVSLVDFGETEVFSRVSAYIGLLVAKRQVEASHPLQVTRIGKLPERFRGRVFAPSDTVEIHYRDSHFQVDTFVVPQPREDSPWVFVPQSDRLARTRVNETSSQTLSEIAGIFQGIKTGANDVFVLSLESTDEAFIGTYRNGFGDVSVLESDLLHPVAFGSHIQKYEHPHTDQYILYPYRDNELIPWSEMEESFPNTARYLLRHKIILDGRRSTSQSGLQWYELIRRRDEAWLSKSKLIIRDLATENAFAVDLSGTIYLIGGTAVVPADEANLIPLLAYLNSDLMTWFLSSSTPGFRRGFRKIEPQHLENLPVMDAVIEDGGVSEQLKDLATKAMQLKADHNLSEYRAVELEINRLICSVAGIAPEIVRA